MATGSAMVMVMALVLPNLQPWRPGLTAVLAAGPVA